MGAQVGMWPARSAALSVPSLDVSFHLLFSFSCPQGPFPSLLASATLPPGNRPAASIGGGDQSVGSSIAILLCFHRCHDLHTSQGGSGGLDVAGTDKGLLPGSKVKAKGLWDAAKYRPGVGSNQFNNRFSERAHSVHMLCACAQFAKN